MGWTVRGSNNGGRGEILSTRPDRPWVPPSLLCNGYPVFPGGKAAGAWRWPPTPFGAEVKERVKIYLYSPSGLSWPLLGWTLPYCSWTALKVSFEIARRNTKLGFETNACDGFGLELFVRWLVPLAVCCEYCNERTLSVEERNMSWVYEWPWCQEGLSASGSESIL